MHCGCEVFRYSQPFKTSTFQVCSMDVVWVQENRLWNKLFFFLQTQFAGWFLSSLTCGNELKTGTERISSKIQSESIKGCLSSALAIRWGAYSFRRSSEGIHRSWWLGCSLDGDCRKARGKTEVFHGNTSVSPSEEVKKVGVKREVWASLLLVIFSQLRWTESFNCQLKWPKETFSSSL